MRKNESPSVISVGAALLRCSHGLIGVGLFSAALNILALTGSIYMLQVYDRVIPSGSVPTLVGLTIAVVGLYFVYGLLDTLRLRLLVRIANRLDITLHKRVFRISNLLPLRLGADSKLMDPIRDLDTIRSFLSGVGPTAIFDLPWIPFYLVLIFLLHADLGALALAGTVVIVSLTLLTEVMARRPSQRVTASGNTRRITAEAGRRNAEVIRAMGLGGRLEQLWSETSTSHLRHQQSIADVVGGAGSLSRSLRLCLQSLMLGLGAWLVIEGQASGGVIIASSIMLGRALAPVDVAIGSWKGFLAARRSWGNLNRMFKAFNQGSVPMALPRPQNSLTVENLTASAPGQPKPIITNVSFHLGSGAGLGVIGPSGSGKSTLVRVLVGVWTASGGKVRLDGAALDNWDPDEIGRHVGYLPQDIELFDGTVAENIARFAEAPDPSVVIAAAQTAGVLDLILRLPEGFQTRVGEGGAALSAGQRQLIGLARALYSDPFLVVLDEPNSNLDADGDAALTAAINSVRRRGGIVIVVAHRPSALAGIDQLLVMAAGSVQAFGPRDEVLERVTRPPAADDRGRAVVPLHGSKGH